MKKRFVLIWILVLSLVLSPVAYANNQVKEGTISQGFGDNDLAIVGDNERANLLRWGMSEEEISDLTYGELRDFIENLSYVPIDSVQAFQLENQIHASEEMNNESIRVSKNLTVEEMEMLYNLSIFPEQVAQLSEEEIRDILDPYSTPSTYATNGMYDNYVTDIPYFGQYDEESATYFHERVELSRLDSHCTHAMLIAQHCFNRTYNFSSTRAGQNIAFTYNLWGELTGSVSHEGIDMVDKITSARPIYSATPGEIVGPVGGTYGQVRVYDEELDKTVVYLHMKNIPNWVQNKQYTVGLADTIGAQGSVGANGAVHLHVQVQPGSYTNTYLPSQNDYNLESNLPYFIAAYHI